MNRKVAQQGFTIVELLIAITVSVILSGVILGFMAGEIDQSTVATAKAALLSQAEIGLARVNTDVRLSSNADDQNRWPDSYAPVSGNAYSWASNGSTLILATAAQGPNYSILWQDANEYIPYKNNLIYFVKNGTLYKRTLAAPESGNVVKTSCPSQYASSSCPADEIILSNVSSFTVTYLDGNGNSIAPSSARSIVLQISLSEKSFGQTINESYTTQMVFRDD